MKKFLSLILAILIAISLPVEAGKRSGGFGGHRWGKSNLSSNYKFKKRFAKKRLIAGSSASSAALASERIEASNHNKSSTKNTVTKDIKKISKDTDWADHTTLDEHYSKHGTDFNAVDSKDYAFKANSFYKNRNDKAIRKKIDNKGTIRLWNPETNEFGSYTRDGKTKTYFKPRSKTYWDRQSGEEINV